MKKVLSILIILMVQLLHTKAECPFQGLKPFSDTLCQSLKHPPTFFFNLLSFNSFINDDFVNFYGFRMGLQYNRRVKFGFGLFQLSPNAVVSSINVMEDTTRYVTNGNLEARYFSLAAEYIFYNRYPWQVSILPVDFGIGGAHYSFNSRSGGGRRLETPDVALIFYQPGVTAQFSIVKWFGLAASAGYRFTLYSSKEVKEDFNAPGFSAGIKLFLDEVYNAVFPHGVRFSRSKNSKELDATHTK
jgi:hypothetical protein